MEPRARPTKGIIRPSAMHLSLPLEDHRSRSDHTKNKLTLIVPSSSWSINPGPKSSASTYSQGSWTNSPVAFSELRVNRRRFAIAISPSQDGPWNYPFPSANVSVPANGLLQLVRSDDTATSVGNEVLGEGGVAEEKQKRKKKKKKQKQKGTKSPTLVEPSTALISVSTTGSRTSRMIGKMFPRRLARPPQSAGAVLEPVIVIVQPPPLPILPPQVSVTLPSPELRITDVLERMGDSERDNTANGSARPPPLHLQLHESQPADLSPWKPKRPPSPAPLGVRRKTRVRHSRKAAICATSLPPVPAITKRDTSVIPSSRREAISTISSSPPPAYQLHSIPKPMENHVFDSEKALQAYLKARAAKSATYVLHDGGIFSPTSSVD